MHCPMDGVELVKARSYIRRMGEDWDVALFLIEEQVCPTCKMRVELRGKILTLGGGTKQIVNE